MKHTQNGSTILMVIIFMTILAIIGLSAFKSSIFLQHFAIAREHLIVNETLAKSLLNYGISLALADFDEICKNKQKQEIELNIDQDIGRVTLSGTKQSISLMAQLKRNGSFLYKAHCLVRKNSDQKLAIEGFQTEGFPL